MKIDIPIELSDNDLEARLKSLARGEREATSLLIAHLAEFDARRLFLGAGFSSLFTYCCEELHLSEPAAYDRIEVARAARSFPAILPMLAEGLLSRATVRLLAPHLTAENQQELLAQAMGKSKRAVEEMLVRHFPRPEVVSSVRKVTVRLLAPERYGFRFTASAEARENLREAQDLLRHSIPNGDPAQIVERALKLLVELRDEGASGSTVTGAL